MKPDNKKHIILCSDGTGNKGGYGADSNVYKLYKAIDIRNNKGIEQYTFYDNGVGTQSNKIVKAVSGAFGVGLAQNVIDLYTFLASSYNPGDSIYLFGFSRGAATIRAFAGFVQICGLVNRFEADGKTLKSPSKLKDEIDEAFECYKKNNPEIEASPEAAIVFKKSKALNHKLVPEGNVPIMLIGVWDTVSALGFTPDWKWLFGDKYSSQEQNAVSKFFKNITAWIFPHKFYNYQLNKNVEWVYHALSIDDERLTFKPRIWREEPKEGCTKPLDRPQNIEQVWFPGVHSSVGGGYERTGMSDVALDWMFKKAGAHDILFHDQCCDEVEAKANAHGKIYDSRDGLAMFYRYTPRNITELCLSNNKIEPENLKLHKSAYSRMKYRTGGYAPGELPANFIVVEQKGVSDRSVVVDKIIMEKTLYDQYQQEIQYWVKLRKSLYHLILGICIILTFGALWLWKYPEYPPSYISTLASHIMDIGNYLLPEVLENSFSYLVLNNRLLLVAIILAALGIFFYSKWVNKKQRISHAHFRNGLLGIKASD